MKNKLRLVFILIFAIISMLVFVACNNDPPPDDDSGGGTDIETGTGEESSGGSETETIPYNYSIKDGEVTIIRYLGTDAQVVVPLTIKGNPVTTIAAMAFDWRTTVTSITFEDNNQLKNIGVRAFYGCSSLETVNFGKNNQLKNIGDRAFYGCSSLETVDFGQNNQLENIGDYAFANCDSLKSFHMPESVKTVEAHTFDSTNINSFYITSISAWCGIQFKGYPVDNVWDGGETYLYLNETKVTHLVIPEGVEKIGKYQFANIKINSVTIPAGVTSIGTGAFFGCGVKNLLLTDLSAWCDISFESNRAPFGNVNLYLNGEKVTNLVVPDDVTTIDAYRFANFNISSVTIPASVTSIEPYAFLNSGVENLFLADLSAWCNLSFVNSEPVFDDVDLYLNGEKVTNLVIPDDVTTIGQYQFANFNISSVTIPASVTSMSERSFEGCSLLNAVTFEDNSQLKDIKGYTFYNCQNLATVDFGQNGQLENIESYAFFACSSLTSVCLPKSLKTVGSTAFGSNIKDLYITDLVAWCDIQFDGAVVTSVEDVNFYLNGTKVTQLDIPEGVTTIGEYQFARLSGITSVYIPASLTTMGQSAFEFCKNIETVTFADDSQLTTIGKSAFYGCKSLKNIELPESLTTIGKHAFGQCAAIESVSFVGNSQLRSIEDSTFSGCTSLINFVIPDGVTSISREVFSGCSNLVNITIPESVTYIGNHAFDGCSSLVNVTIPEGVSTIGDFAFGGCSSLVNVTIPEGVSTIGDLAFDGCSSLLDITIPKSITSIGYNIFFGCNNLAVFLSPQNDQTNWDRNWNDEYRPVYMYSEKPPMVMGNFWHYEDGVAKRWYNLHGGFGDNGIVVSNDDVLGKWVLVGASVEGQNLSLEQLEQEFGQKMDMTLVVNEKWSLESAETVDALTIRQSCSWKIKSNYLVITTWESYEETLCAFEEDKMVVSSVDGIFFFLKKVTDSDSDTTNPVTSDRYNLEKIIYSGQVIEGSLVSSILGGTSMSVVINSDGTAVEIVAETYMSMEQMYYWRRAGNILTFYQDEARTIVVEVYNYTEDSLSILVEGMEVDGIKVEGMEMVFVKQSNS